MSLWISLNRKLHNYFNCTTSSMKLTNITFTLLNGVG